MASIVGPRRMRRALIGAAFGPVLAAGLLTGCGAAAQAGPRQASSEQTRPAGAGTTGPAAAAAVQQEFVSVIQRVLPSVVEIRTNAGLGSGVVLDADGDIVTNAHVVAGASSFQVLSATATVAGSGSAASSSAPRPAVLVGSCPADDLAVIRVDADAGLHPATFANSASVTVGDIVLAIGSPLGLGGSVAEPASAGTQAAVLTDTIQTSAAINPGNSGGALVSIEGEVVGIPTLAAVNRDAGGAAPGIGFAIPASIAVSIGRALTGTGGTNFGTVPSGCQR